MNFNDDHQCCVWFAGLLMTVCIGLLTIGFAIAGL